MATERQEPNVRQLELIGAAGGVGVLASIAYVCQLLFEATGFGVALGVLMGTGTYLYLPYFLQWESEVDVAREWVPDGVHAGAVGLGLSTGGVLALTVAMIDEPGLTALAAGLGAGILVGIGLTFVLPEEPGT